MKEAYEAADDVIAALAAKGHDYSSHREAIALGFWDGLLNGNWDVTVECSGLKDLRFIQEDEYDQHMDDDPEKPTWESMLFGPVRSVPAYVWFVGEYT